MKLKSAAPVSVSLALLLCSCGRAPTGAASEEASARASDQACAPSGELAYVCGPVNAEDILQIGASDWLVASGMSGFQGPPTVGNLYLVNHRTKTFEAWFPGKNPVLKQDTTTFGMCPGPVNLSTFVSHGLALHQETSGRYRLYITSHGSREAIEVFDIEIAEPKPAITWVGCVVLPPKTLANGVAILPDGGFVATNTMDPTVPNGFAEMLTGKITGNVYVWHPGAEVAPLAGTELSGPNGIELSPDVRWMFVTASGSREIVRFDLRASPISKQTASLDILPDDLHWTSEGTLYTAGRNYVPPSACTTPDCSTGWSIIEIEPDTLRARRVAGADQSAALQGASSAIAVGNEVWIGTYGGNRVGYLPKH